MAQVEISGGDATLVLPIRNISIGGVYVALDETVRQTFGIGQRVSVYLDAEPSDKAVTDVSTDDTLISENALNVTLSGTIVRIDDGGIAVKWEPTEMLVAERFVRVFDALRQQRSLTGAA